MKRGDILNVQLSGALARLGHTDLLISSLPELELVPHDTLKGQLPDARVVVRTGEFTPYSNVFLRYGVAF